jgi:predicted MPP superfamily phosphohydrolase
MSDMLSIYWILIFLLFLIAWVGHACIWVSVLNNFYGRPLSKWLLKAWRLFTGILILAFPLLHFVDFSVSQFYVWPCIFIGGVVFPAITIQRLLRKSPSCVVAESTRTLDLWNDLGHKLIGDGHYATVTRLPGNCVFRVDFTDLTLALPELPPEWEGLTILMLSDLHFHGTPARPFFDRIVDELVAAPPPDLVCLVGDYVDTDTHDQWIQPVVGRLTATEAKFAILGNHDVHHNPDRVRSELAAAGYTVLGNSAQRATIRGVECVVVGHEGPWFAPGPDLSTAPQLFRLCLSHTPDNFYWGIANRINLMLCGHVHGGSIRLPVMTSIFVPSIYGRRFDQGVFAKSGTVMVVNRGVSGKEPLRFRCNPQVIRVKLVRQK